MLCAVHFAGKQEQVSSSEKNREKNRIDDAGRHGRAARESKQLGAPREARTEEEEQTNAGSAGRAGAPQAYQVTVAASGFRSPRLPCRWSVVGCTCCAAVSSRLLYNNYCAKLAPANNKRISRCASRLAEMISLEQMTHMLRHFQCLSGSCQTHKSARPWRSKQG